MSKHEMHNKRHRYHLFALFSPVIAFIPLIIFVKINPIYLASIAMLIGGIATILCRPDLKKKILYSGGIFLAIYFIFFLSFNLAYPNAVKEFWNIADLLGIFILGVPVEELLFAFTFGLMWSSAYEHILWYKSKNQQRV